MGDVGPLYARTLTDIGVADAHVLPAELNQAVAGSPLKVCLFELMEEFNDLGSNERQLKRLLDRLQHLTRLDIEHLEQGWPKGAPSLGPIHDGNELGEVVRLIHKANQLIEANIKCIRRLVAVRKMIRRNNAGGA